MRKRIALLAGLCAIAALAIPASASAVTPSVVNSSNWVLGAAFQGKTDCAASTCATNSNNRIRMLFVVRHDPGVSVTNVIVDKDWDGTNDLDCGCSANTTQAPTITKQVVTGGAIYSHVELNYDFSPHTSNTGMESGNTAVVRSIFAEVNVSSGTDPELSDTVRFFDATDNSGESYPYFYNRSQDDTDRVNPGDSVTYSFRGDDPDGGGPNSGSDWGGYIYRVRRINSDGSITTTQGDTTVCFNARSDGAAKTLQVTFPNRGYYYVEAYGINSGPGSANSTCHTGNSFASYWFIGDAEVNSSNTTLSGTLSVPPKVAFNASNAGTASVTSLDDTDVGGLIQNVEWDANGNTTDGDADDGFEANTLGEIAGLTSDTQTINSVGRAEGSTIPIRARLTDNGAINGTDPRRAVRTLPTQNTVVNTRPVPSAQTVAVNTNSSANPITLTGTDADGDSLTFTTVGAPSHGALGGSGANRTYTPDPGYAGTDSFTFRANDGMNDSASTATVSIQVRPGTTITERPDLVSTDRNPVFRFNSDATLPPTNTLGFQCKLNTEPDFTECDSPKQYLGLPDGIYTFQVRAEADPGDVVDATPDSYTWTIDATPPETQIDDAPPPLTNSQSATFEFSSPGNSNATFECRLDSEPDFTTCPSGQTYNDLSPTTHTFRVRAKDTAGNVDPTPATHIWTIDTSPPDTNITAGPNNPTNQTSASFNYEVTPAAQGNSTFMCKLDDGDFEPCGGPALSSSTSYAGPLGQGPHTFHVFATDAAGNADQTPDTHTWVVDTSPPEVTIDDRPGDPTNETTADFEFSADEAGTFKCSLDGATPGACDPPSSGTSGTAGYAGLDEGPHTFSVTSTDAAGNTSDAATYMWTVDLTPPFTSITQKPDDPSNDTTPEFRFEADEEDSTFECRLDSNAPDAFDPCSSPFEAPALDDGTHRFEVRATDPAGNPGSAASYQWTVDTMPPQVSIDDGPDDPTNSPNANFTFSADESGDFLCSIDGAAPDDCGSGTDGTYGETGLSAGPHTFSVTSTDAAGNTSDPVTYQWTIDTTPPTTTIGDKPQNPTKSTSADFTFTSNEPGSTFECRLDGGSPPTARGVSVDDGFRDCPPASYSGLADGPHTFEVRATDPAGNVETNPASYTWTIDTAAPVVTITDAPDASTNQTSAHFEFNVTGDPATVRCTIDTETPVDCTSPEDYPTLSPGPHTFTVEGTDAADNSGSDSHTWTIDTAVPDTTIDSSPPDSTPSSTATFSFSSDESPATFECSLDNGAFSDCDSPHSYSSLPPGAHTFRVQATDSAGNTDPTPAEREWTVLPPQGVLGQGAGSPVIKRRLRALNIPNEASFQIATITCRARSCTVTRKEAKIKIGGETYKPPVTVEVVAKESAEALDKGEIAQVVVHFSPDVKKSLAANDYGQLVVKLAAESNMGHASSFRKIKLKAKFLKKLVGP